MSSKGVPPPNGGAMLYRLGGAEPQPPPHNDRITKTRSRRPSDLTGEAATERSRDSELSSVTRQRME
jgi:hypothetical protein